MEGNKKQPEREDIEEIIKKLQGLGLGNMFTQYDGILRAARFGLNHAVGVPVKDSKTVLAITDDPSLISSWMARKARVVGPTYSKVDTPKTDRRSEKVWSEIDAVRFRPKDDGQVKKGLGAIPKRQMDRQSKTTTSSKTADRATQTGTEFEPTWDSLLGRLKECASASSAQERREKELFAEFWEYWEDDSCPIPEQAHFWAEEIEGREGDLNEIRRRRRSREESKEFRVKAQEKAREELERKKERRVEKQKELEAEERKAKEAWEKVRKLKREAERAASEELFADLEARKAERKQERRGERRCPICSTPGVIKGNNCPNRFNHKDYPEYHLRK